MFSKPFHTGRLFRLAAISIVGLSSLAVAAPPPPDGAPPPPGQGRPDADGRPRPMQQIFEDYRQLIGSLNLDKDQAKTVRDAMQSTRESLQAMGKDAQTMSAQERLATFREAIEKLNNDIAATLNDEQKKKFDAGVEEIRTKAEANLRNGRAGANDPTSRPADGPGGGPGGPGGRIAERIDRAVDAAEATPEQREKLKPILDEAKEKIQAIIADAQANGTVDRQAIGAKAREVIESVRDQAAGILSADQLEKFRAAMQPNRPGGPGGGPGGPGGSRPPQGRGGDGGKGPNANGDPPPPPPPAGNKPTASNSNAHPEAGTAGLAASTANTPTTKPLSIGDKVPAFELTRLDGHALTNKSLAGKPAVLIFGSLTAPSFRDRAPLLSDLAKKYGGRVRFVIVYTREQHPIGVDEPERNRDDHIAIAAHATAKDRAAAAKTAHDQLELTMDVVTDSMDDALTNQLDGFPNAAVILDGEGTLVDHEKWVEPFALERALDRLLQHK